jgi:DNA-binding NarL/FixJ family response regulator
MAGSRRSKEAAMPSLHEPAAPPASPPVLVSTHPPTIVKAGAMKILVVDDHPLILEALHHVLTQLGADVTVLDAASGPAGRALAAAHPDADLMLFDLGLPGIDGFALLGELRESHPAIPVVVLSGSERREDVLRALDLGAMGYIPKSARNEVMLQALRLVLSGGVFLPPSALAADAPAPATARPTSARDLELTERQVEVLALILEGKPNKLICRHLGLAEGTVKIHVAACLRALGVHTRTQAVIEASRLGITTDSLRPRASGSA